MVRIIFFIVVFGVIYFLFRLVSNSIGFGRCEHCDGKGYWRGLRGEMNNCKICNGTGKM